MSFLTRIAEQSGEDGTLYIPNEAPSKCTVPQWVVGLHMKPERISTHTHFVVTTQILRLKICPLMKIAHSLKSRAEVLLWSRRVWGPGNSLAGNFLV